MNFRYIRRWVAVLDGRIIDLKRNKWNLVYPKDEYVYISTLYQARRKYGFTDKDFEKAIKRIKEKKEMKESLIKNDNADDKSVQ